MDNSPASTPSAVRAIPPTGSVRALWIRHEAALRTRGTRKRHAALFSTQNRPCVVFILSKKKFPKIRRTGAELSWQVTNVRLCATHPTTRAALHRSLPRAPPVWRRVLSTWVQLAGNPRRTATEWRMKAAGKSTTCELYSTSLNLREGEEICEYREVDSTIQRARKWDLIAWARHLTTWYPHSLKHNNKILPCDRVTRTSDPTVPLWWVVCSSKRGTRAEQLA